MATPPTPSAPAVNKLPTPPAPETGVPRDTTIPAGKVVVLVDTTQTPNAVTLYKVAVKPIRVFTAWSVNIYADEATAKADIAAKGWKYTPTEAPTK